MNDCVFCKILNKQIPSYKIYEDENVYAFLDISKDINGHTLVIPKQHCCNVLDCEEQTLNKVVGAVKKISKHYISLGYDGVNILNNNNPSAQQSVMHLHFHIIPRKNNDNINLYSKLNEGNISLEEMQNKLKLN